MKKSIIVFLSFVMLFSACREETPEPGKFREIVLDEKSAQIVEAENEFGFELFRKIFASEMEYENIMVSPFSVSLALAMTYNGAGGETKKVMEETLKLYGLTPEEINTSYQMLLKALKSLDKKVILEIANAIFYRDDFHVESEFISTNKKYYDAEVSALNFGSPNALTTINDWVANKTHDKIDKILDKITGQQIMFLINAIYFKGIWQSEFDKKNTVKKDFYLENGSTVKTDFMQQENSVLYSSNEIFQAVQLPYGQGNYTMYVFLPQSGKSLQDIMENLGKESWKNWDENFMERNVDVELPKFKFEYELTMNEVLTDMGMGIAFTRDVADFTGINRGGGLNIDYVKHKSFIEVNEEGTEAAAVTVVAIEFTSVGGTSKVPFYVNRPFLFTITEKSTGAVLFMGTVKNPLLN